MEYSDNFYSESESFYFPLSEDFEQPIMFFNNDENPLKSTEEFYSTLPPSWFEDADALLYNATSKDIDPVGDLSKPVPELSVSPELYYSNIDIGYPPVPDPQLTASLKAYDYSIEAGYLSMPVPELTVSPEPIDYNLNEWQYYSTDAEPTPILGFTLVQHAVGVGCVRSNSEKHLCTDHMEIGMTTLDILSNNVTQRSQELEITPAFESDQHVVENTSGYLISELPLYPITFDESIPDLSPIPITYPSSSFPVISNALPYPSSVETMSQFFPIRPESLPLYLSPAITISSQLFPSTPDASSDVLPYPSPMTTSSFPTTPQDRLYSSPEPCVPTVEHHPPPHLPSKKRGRKPKKNDNIPPTQQKPRRKFPNGRSSVRSQEWIDRYFSDGICRICKGGSSNNRLDRVLEHLVSAHFVQAVKNVQSFDTEQLLLEADVRRHFIGTEAQFEYTRRYINSVRCSYCPGDSSLVLRDKNIVDHLMKRHGRVKKQRVEEQKIQEERERLNELILVAKRGKFYSIHDQFLYGYPGGASSRLW
ncbi:hypothetical protein Clacol_010407 [Clathrus columnatus]|uniref:BED-type domain-containing protein n=1 Tax=Clathrus columnatus TaxID=1419009 RepID=A0AAV5AN73_9AGAM|nr:hypothetical protein Clacol_010407 [Clathrus columnatus]